MLVFKLSHVSERGPWCICFEETYHRISRTWTRWDAAWAVAIWMSPRKSSLNLNFVKYRLSMASILLSNRFEIITAMFCRKCQSDLATEKLDIRKCDIARFEFEVSFGVISQIATASTDDVESDMMTSLNGNIFALLAIHEGNPPVTRGFPLTRAGDSMF